VTSRILVVDDGPRLPLPRDADTGAARPLDEGFDVVILLSARGQGPSRLKDLKLAADERVVEPVQMADLLSRLEARVRPRPVEGGAGSLVCFGNVEVDLQDDAVRVDGRAVTLATKELRLLRYLVERPGATVSREELLREVWGYSATPLTRTVDVHVAWLRRKLEPNPRHPRFILTVHGLGYKFVGDRPPLSAQGATLTPSARV
jgi:two-component system alkaline phosphatase synthesis response regulator PhoP